jgi:hypothetical protein
LVASKATATETIVSRKEAPTGAIEYDKEARILELADSQGTLRMRINCSSGCLVDSVEVNGREVVSAETGVCTGIQSGGNWATTRKLSKLPTISCGDSSVEISGIEFSAGGISVRETWRFHLRQKSIEWRIVREYLNGGTLDDSYFPGWDFSSMSTWTGAILDTGGVAWSRYLSRGASYGSQAGTVRFWHGEDALTITPREEKGTALASRFTHQPSGIFTFAQSVTTEPLKTREFLRRSVGGNEVWAPFHVLPGKVETHLTMESGNANLLRDRGTFEGVDGPAIRDLLDTIARYGVVDRAIVGGNGWLTGWVCLHEPFFAQIALALGDKNYTANLAMSLDAWRDHALQKDGRVYSRWHHDEGDNMVPGTYDPQTGYYECGWGYLLDSQPDYVTNVAELFDLTGDEAWLRSHKEPCERALEWLLARDTDGDGLVEMMTDSHKDAKASDWLDVIWASHENAFVNAQLYNALILWAEREAILGDFAKADRYRNAAARLKESFIRPIDEGGFWNPVKGWFCYWRDKDGSIHGDNLVSLVNFAAVAYGLCTETQRQTVLGEIEKRMRKEGLFHWPSCFTSFAPGEGSDDRFPNYENGDIFLSWGELGVRAYAGNDPDIALKYVRKLIERYCEDGLSFQRYLRESQTGAGDDILSGNCMTIVGLYRDILGIRPQWNRLVLDPHMPQSLDGTHLSYQLRGQLYQLAPGIKNSTGTASGFTVTAPNPFGFNVTPDRAIWYSAIEDKPSLEIERRRMAEITVEVLDWPQTSSGERRWRETGAQGAVLNRKVHGLSPGASFRLTVNGSQGEILSADSHGSISFGPVRDSSTFRTFDLIPQ